MSQTGFTASAGQRRHDGLDGLQTGEGGVEFMRIGETKGILHARPPLPQLHFLSFAVASLREDFHLQ
ncbi:hypothetical protein DSQ78_13450 [Salmonella enterica subsp. enterica serovar Typhimurium]|nr:hypothetical protein [Salmonella enterica subsp. enterica serovar Typhimurium]